MTLVNEAVNADVLRFPTGFRWGAATAAYQIEGAATADGRTPSIWDTFARTPGRVDRGHTGDVACDHYHRYAEDVALLAELGIGTYRFSLSWPRIKPDGVGPVNPRGLDFYDRLVDELCGRGITPMVTVYHWDLPQCLEDRGGWANRDTAQALADFALAAYAVLGDRVPTWTTLNEPYCSAFLGYASGDHAPGRTDPGAAFRAAHHLLLGHGLTARALREAGARELSYTVNLSPVTPRDADDAHDVAAAWLIDGLHNRLFLDPVLRGGYPADIVPVATRFAGTGYRRDGDDEIIATPVDLLGVNYYQPTVVAARIGTPPKPSFPGSEGVEFVSQDRPTTVMDWPIDADGLCGLLVRLGRDYPGTPIMITENGAAFEDVVAGDRVADPERVEYLRGHLHAARAAISAGVDLRGYLAWSFLDNFEWAYGYDKRFGLVHVDYASQRRRLKDSAHWYRQVMANNGLAG
jgi:beta-glucosidase